TRDEARRDVDQRRTFHPSRESDNVLCTDDIRAQSALERRIESHVTSRIDNDVNIIGDCLCFFLAVAEVRLGDVTASDDHLVINETLERATITLAQRIERRRRNDVVPETILRLLLRTRAHGKINLPNTREPVKQHTQRNLAEKPRAPDQED